MLAILKKELKTYYSSLFAYVYYVIFFLVTGILYTKNCINTYSTEFGYSVLQYGVFVVILMIPFCTMRIFSQEKRQKTDQLLFTAPVSTISILSAKYIATAIYVLLPVLLSLIYPFILSFYGTLSVGFLFSGYLGSVLLILTLLGIGVFISTLTANAILSAVLTYGVYLLIMAARVLEGITSSHGLFRFLHEISVYNKYYDMISGIVRRGDIIYFVLLIVFFFLMTWVSLLSSRQSLKKTVCYSVIFVWVMLIGGAGALLHSKVYDFTPEQILSLSEETVKNVSKIKNETGLYYIGNESQANATYVELLNVYQNLNDNIHVSYVSMDDESFKQTYLADIPSVEEASIVVATENRYIYLDSEKYISTVQNGYSGYEQLLEIEDQLTSAILYCNTDELMKIEKITGHSEKTLGNSFRNLLNLSQYEIESLSLDDELSNLSSTKLTDAAALLIYSPQEDYSEDDITQLKEYVNKGGKLIVSIDPLNENLPNLYEFLSSYGLNLQSGVVIERTPGYYILDTNYYLTPAMAASDYTKELVKRDPIVFAYTSKGIARYGSKNGYECTDILLTTAGSFSKVDNFDDLSEQGDNDKWGPFSVASVSHKDGAGTVFLISTDIMLTDEADTESGGANSRFFTEMVKQVAGSDSAIWIQGKNVDSQTAHIGHSVSVVIRIIAIAVIPVIVLLVGIIVLLGRKKNWGFRLKEKRMAPLKKKGQSESNDEE